MIMMAFDRSFVPGGAENKEREKRIQKIQDPSGTGIFLIIVIGSKRYTVKLVQ